jgi:germination protein M
VAVRPALLLIAAALLVAGCSGGDGESTTTGTETTTAAETTSVRVYFLRDGKVWPAAREVDSVSFESAALTELFEGPSSDEQELGFETAIPGGGPTLTIEDSVARFQPQGDYPTEALAQIVYTLTQFSSIDAVEVDRRYTRADFEELTPSVLVESPLPFEEVTSPLRVTGTANTFEANFNYELTDTDGLIVDENFVTATSGTGTRGTFDFTTAPYTVPFDGIGSLIVFELSAQDGSRINLVEIPLRMEK